mmetsp:Transcript_20239/g.27921  ORF Transcript_20239/g.27921 Transcript_20239/m.27921 type:complete len:137 (-) Transcript_20239:123-533(-)
MSLFRSVAREIFHPWNSEICGVSLFLFVVQQEGKGFSPLKTQHICCQQGLFVEWYRRTSILNPSPHHQNGSQNRCRSLREEEGPVTFLRGKNFFEEKLGGSKFSLFLRSDFRFLSFDLDDLVLPQFCASWAMEVIG